MRIIDIKKGDIITYRSGRVNNVNHPDAYWRWYNEDFTHIKWDFSNDIMKIERYVKFLGFYRLVTVYERAEKCDF